MNELIELARFREEVAEQYDGEALARARNRLVRRVTEQPQPSVSRMLTRRRLVMAVAVAVVAAGAVIAVDALVVGDRPVGASADAASVLNQAADSAIGAEDPMVGPDEYLHVTTLAVYSSGNGDATWLESYTDELFVPGDPASDWIMRRSPRVPYRPEDAELAEQNGITESNGGFTERARDGAFFDEPFWPSRAYLADLSRDPEELLATIRQEAGDAGPSRDGEALVLIADLLRTGVVPADLRAALFRTAALIQGVELTDRQANLNGQTGVAVGRYEPNGGTRSEIIFDPDTGLVIGEREVLVEGDWGPLLPAGSTVAWTATTTDVVPAAEVDEIPADPMD